MLNEEYKKALDTIRKDAYPYQQDEEIFESMIENYLLRKDGRLGEMKNGFYYPPR